MFKHLKDVRFSFPMEHVPVAVATVVTAAALCAGLMTSGPTQAELVQQHTMSVQ